MGGCVVYFTLIEDNQKSKSKRSRSRHSKYEVTERSFKSTCLKYIMPVLGFLGLGGIFTYWYTSKSAEPKGMSGQSIALGVGGTALAAVAGKLLYDHRQSSGKDNPGDKRLAGDQNLAAAGAQNGSPPGVQSLQPAPKRLLNQAGTGAKAPGP